MMSAFARIREDVTLSKARADLDLVTERMQSEHPAEYPKARGFRIGAVPLRDELTRSFKTTLLVLLGTAGFVLLIVCASVANLMESRAAFARADPAQRDPRTQFYVAYSFYRQGWGRLYNDNALFAQGLAAIDRAIAVAPDHRLIVDDAQLGIHSADELRAELQRGVTHELSDFNPLKVFRQRK